MKNRHTIFFTVILVTLCTSCITKNAYKDKIIEAMIGGCIKNTQNQEVCDCFGNKVKDKYSYEELKKVEDDEAGEFAQSFQEFLVHARQTCTEETGYIESKEGK